jgi:protein-S-isoprenylcysteine O-methyltransferase Ste14
MRNPIRLKNLKLRFALLYLLGALALYFLRPDPLNFAIGGSLVALGSVLRTWGAGHLVKNDRLTVTGPYAHLRHPLYAGTLLVGSGFALIAGGVLSWVLLAILMPWFFLMYFPRKERIESERLEVLYGDEFARYRDAVPALFPSPRAWHPAAGQGDAFDDLARTWSRHRYIDNNELGTLIALVAGLCLFVARAQVGG